ncbi:hypothetical protein GIY62_06300 [Burkholderia plantarii]|uniref:hypothetical protein n=1 Tax=Burkholderia plantarii TaxID=41899 RepID=UPI00272A2D2E|nr:hypothetical protein [Burkholderia plantarii]WLE60269.1 hypothetical protein GIY62_06300 [Burkholderia plantarii]
MSDDKAALSALRAMFEAWAVGPNGSYLPEEVKRATPPYQHLYERASLNDAWDGWQAHADVAAAAVRKVMARLTELLDEDQFGNIESIVREAGFSADDQGVRRSDGGAA